MSGGSSTVSILGSLSTSVIAAVLAPMVAKWGSTSLTMHYARSAGQMNAGTGSRDSSGDVASE